ncbi:hypothetical protein BaRGS_00024363 [Batillaria attramentaria]|uniref:Uncharacterized protein n=1 Tax=Batillaria attramentaria TaxID=370345 RepID=A0ABD0KB97_9CAEN
MVTSACRKPKKITVRSELPCIYLFDNYTPFQSAVRVCTCHPGTASHPLLDSYPTEGVSWEFPGVSFGGAARHPGCKRPPVCQPMAAVHKAAPATYHRSPANIRHS